MDKHFGSPDSVGIADPVLKAPVGADSGAKH